MSHSQTSLIAFATPARLISWRTRLTCGRTSPPPRPIPESNASQRGERAVDTLFASSPRFSQWRSPLASHSPDWCSFVTGARTHHGRRRGAPTEGRSRPQRNGPRRHGSRRDGEGQAVRAATVPSGRLRVYESLARALGIDGASRRCVAGGHEWLGGAPCSTSPPASHGALVTVARGVPGARVKRVQAAHLRGVSVAWRWVFTHPGNLAAQAVGLVAPTVSPGGGVGQSGLEATYDRYLRAGDTLSTSLDAGLQRAGEAALRTSLERDDAPGGSFVAMNPATGEVYAMGSLPTYDGSTSSRLSSPSQICRLAPVSSLLNRATQAPDRPARCLRRSPPPPRFPAEAGRPRVSLTTQGSTASGEARPSSVATMRAMP